MQLPQIPRYIICVTSLLTTLAVVGVARAEEELDGAAKLAALLQDPLANISALASDNTASFKTGPEHDDQAYEINLQPVYSINFPERGFSIVARATIPYIGVKPGTDLPRLSEDGIVLEDKGDKGREWGMSDIVTQFFYAPMGQEGWKFGGGPMISWKTRTDKDLAGPGGGAGPVAVAVGALGIFDIAALVGHLWSFDGDNSTTTFQPMVFYNLESVTGAYVGFNNTVSYNHKAKGGNGNAWTVPLGLTAGRTFDMGDGHGFDLNVGAYGLPSFGRPEGGAKWQAKLGLSWVFPR